MSAIFLYSLLLGYRFSALSHYSDLLNGLRASAILEGDAGL